MSEQRIRIVSDGTAQGTKVFTASGEEITGIVGLTIDPIRPSTPITATIELINVELDVTVAKPQTPKRVPPPAPMPDIGGLVGGKGIFPAKPWPR